MGLISKSNFVDSDSLSKIYHDVNSEYKRYFLNYKRNNIPYELLSSNNFEVIFCGKVINNELNNILNELNSLKQYVSGVEFSEYIIETFDFNVPVNNTKIRYFSRLKYQEEPIKINYYNIDVGIIQSCLYDYFDMVFNNKYYNVPNNIRNYYFDIIISIYNRIGILVRKYEMVDCVFVNGAEFEGKYDVNNFEANRNISVSVKCNSGYRVNLLEKIY